MALSRSGFLRFTTPVIKWRKGGQNNQLWLQTVLDGIRCKILAVSISH